MIEEGDVVMACISGGKDSFAMLDILLNLQKAAPIKFEVVAVNLDQKQPGFPEHILPEYFETLNIPYYIVDKDTYSVVKEKCQKVRQRVVYVLVYVVVRFTHLLRKSAQQNLHLVIIWMTS